MTPWIPKLIVLLADVALIAIRAPHGQRSTKVPVRRSHRGRLEVALLTLAWIGFLVPILWLVTPLFRFAEYPLPAAVCVAGVVLLVAGLVLFARAHADLGTNWSITLEVREGHRLVTVGLYRHARHPMYLALLVFSIGQLLVLPNWIAGPAYLVSFGILLALRLRPEERMMREEFGAEWDAYAARTKRLLPFLW